MTNNTFNLEDFKRRWRELAAERGVDAQEGATLYQVANAKADERKASHAARQEQAVYADAQKPDAWKRYDNGYGEVDEIKVERQAARSWWVYDPYWRDGGRRITMIRPKWSEQRLRTSDRSYVRLVVSLDDEQLDRVVSRIPPPDYQAVRNIREEAKRLQGRVDDMPICADRHNAVREAWDGDAYRRRVVKASMPIQMAFAFA